MAVRAVILIKNTMDVMKKRIKNKELKIAQKGFKRKELF